MAQGHVLPGGFRRIWKEWNIPAMVFLSLLIQTVLILTGSRRKYSSRRRPRLVPWLAYLFADWVALVSLSLISNFRTPDDLESYATPAFWAPFLLLHLGGADTITAYNLEDTQTWQRTLLTVSGQVLIFFFIILNAWSGHILNYLSIPILVAGIVKSCERVCSTMRATIKQLRRSMLPPPDPGPNYAKYMDDYSSKRDEGFKVKSEKINEAPMVGHNFRAFPANNFIPEAANLLEAYSFFKVFKCLFADLILTMHDVYESQSFFQSRSSDEVFRVIEIELSFMYDLLYTKAVVLYSFPGRLCRLAAITCIVSVLTIFSAVHNKSLPEFKDKAISYVLLVGALLHEIYAIGLMLRSDWTMMWLSKQRTGAIHLLHKAVSCSFLPYNKRWCNKIGQVNLISNCLEEKRANIYRRVISWWNDVDYKAIPAELKELVFHQLLKKLGSVPEDPAAFKKLCGHRGDWVLVNEKLYESLGWSVKVESDHSVLLWHIATDICYNTGPADESEASNAAGHPLNHKELSKMLSDYMMYLLVERQYMLPDGIGQIRYQDTCAEAEEFFKERRSSAGEKKAASRALVRVNTEIPPSDVKGDRSKSVLFEGCRLAKGLQSLKVAEEKKWELISHVWVEMLCYAGNRCRRYHHAQQLRRGGELLTHVWFLMAHLGITEQFQISQGQARTKLILE